MFRVMSNLFGGAKIGFPGQEHDFQDGGSYKISSAVDGCVFSKIRLCLCVKNGLRRLTLNEKGPKPEALIFWGSDKVLEVPGAKVEQGVGIVSSDWSNSEHQKFRAYEYSESKGRFRLEPKLAPTGAKQVLDQHYSNKSLILHNFKSFDQSVNQQWHAEIIPCRRGWGSLHRKQDE